MKRPMLDAGDANPKTRLRNAPAIDRLMYRTALLNNGCWEWQGTKNPKGYGSIRRDMDGPKVAVHRLAYAEMVGPIPDGLEIDHTCFNRACVNPDHLEPVTHEENVNRGRRNQNHGKTHCIHGHAFDEANTSIDTLGRRVCKTCSRNRTAKYRSAA